MPLALFSMIALMACGEAPQVPAAPVDQVQPGKAELVAFYVHEVAPSELRGVDLGWRGGLLVDQVPKNSQGLRKRDIIGFVESKQVNSVFELNRIIRHAGGNDLHFVVLRDDLQRVLVLHFVPPEGPRDGQSWFVDEKAGSFESDDLDQVAKVGAQTSVLEERLALPSDLPELIKQLESSDRVERIQAALRIAEVGSQAGDAVPALLKNLEHAESSVRMASTIALSALTTPLNSDEVIPGLLRALRDGSAEVRREAASGLGRASVSAEWIDKVRGRLRKMLNDPDRRVRESAARSLDALPS